MYWTYVYLTKGDISDERREGGIITVKTNESVKLVCTSTFLAELHRR